MLTMEDGCECLDCGEEEGGVADGVKVAGGVAEVVDLVDDGCYHWSSVE